MIDVSFKRREANSSTHGAARTEHAEARRQFAAIPSGRIPWSADGRATGFRPYRQTIENMERETGIEPATNSLEGCDSTIELLPLG